MTLQLDRQDIDPELVAPIVPTDREVVTALRRLAAAQAQLLAAEQAHGRSGRRGDGPRRLPEVEEARVALLWVQADLLTAPRAGRRRRAAAEADARLGDLLRRHGFRSFDDYVSIRRDQAPATDPGLDLARREYDAAQRAWTDLQGEFAERTVVLDLTGNEPRRLA